jgi:hypothetical protein
VVLLLLILAVAAVAIRSWQSPARWGTLPFDAIQWKMANSADVDCVRGKMVYRLMRDYRLKGMSRSEIISLLGPPDWVDQRWQASAVSKEAMRDAQEFIYYLGCYSGFRIDTDVLSLHFGENGKVSRVSIWQT